MNFAPEKNIGLRFSEQEIKELTELLDLLEIDYSALTARETFTLLFSKSKEAVISLSSDNQGVNNVISEELQDENDRLSTVNQELVLDNEKLQSDNSLLSEANQEIGRLKLEVEAENKTLKKKAPEVKEVTKEIPIDLNDFQFIVELNHFQLRLAAQVANEHSVESLYNKQSQLNPIAFCRMEGAKKDRIGQILKNTFMGVQFNYHKGDSYLPDNVLSSEKIRKAFLYHEENQE